MTLRETTTLHPSSDLGESVEDGRTIALVRAPGPRLSECELTHLSRVPIDLERATAQHDAYIAALRALAVDVRHVRTLDSCPDAVFVEDTAIVLPEIAVLCRPGAASRIAEVESVGAALAEHRSTVCIQAPGTLEGGDVLRIGSTIFVGRSSRSNDEGIRQLRELVAPHGYVVRGVDLSGCLHLKTAVTQIAPDTLLLNPAWVDGDRFGLANRIEVDPEEPMAANALWVGGSVIHDAAWVATAARMEARGVTVVPVDNSELGKAEGGVTCGSLVFDVPAG